MKTKRRFYIEYIIIIFLFFCLFIPPPVLGAIFPHIKIGVYDLGGVHYIEDAATRSKVAAWYTNHADFIIGGTIPEFSNTNATWVYYTTIIGLYSINTNPKDPLTFSKDIRNFAQSNGYEFENMLVHMKQDFTARYSWLGVDKFDAFEGANGVIVDNDGILTDKTIAGYDAVTGDVTFKTNLYVGYMEAFAEMNFNISSFSSGLSGEWQYWNGSGWSALAVSDGTNNLTQNGKITFIPPAGWKRTIINNSLSKYFLRYHITSYTTLPLITKIYGDNWMTGTKERGWDKNSLTIVNSGELAFNPNPPANATAKFRYQARATGYWSNNYVFMNPAYVVNGKRVWGEFEALKAIADINSMGSKGVYFDSLGGSLSNGISDPPSNQENYSDFVDYTSNSWFAESLEEYRYMVNRIHQTLPSTLVGGNTPYASFAMSGDYGFRESAISPGFGGAISIMNFANDYMTYDNYLPANNPKGLIGIFQHIDTIDYRPSGAFWDRANRGPITSLSSHYIAMNDKTYFHYFSRGGFFYIEADDILVFDSRETVLTSSLTADTSTNVKYIYGQDFSSFPAASQLKPIKIGENIFLYSFTKINNQTLSTTNPVYYPVSTGARIRFVAATNDRLSNYTEGNYLSINNVYRWGKFFPAMFYDIGLPDPAGWNGGNRGIWNTSLNIWRRDFTKAIVLNSPAASYTTREQFENYSPVIDLGGSYRSLKADETLGPVITTIQLRTGEGAILIKSVPSGDTTPPAAPSGVVVQ